MTDQLTGLRDPWLRVIAFWIAGVVCVAPGALAADLLSGTWTSGEGAAGLTYVFKMSGDRFTGIVCGPCDNPATVFEIEDGSMVDASFHYPRVERRTRREGAVGVGGIDTPPDAARQGIQRNVMTATVGAGVNANVMRFTWVGEQSPGQGGEIVMFGPLR